MLAINYTATPEETASATLDFLSNRPIIAIMFSFMKISCLMLCAAFAIALYKKQIQTKDIMTLISAIGWLLFYKRINRGIIKSGLKHRKFASASYSYKIDEKSIYCQINSCVNQHIEWKKIRYILRNNNGYIIPMTGIANAGKFIWLPFSSLKQDDAEQQFLNLAQKFKLKIKPC
jgi:hypothetical protein